MIVSFVFKYYTIIVLNKQGLFDIEGGVYMTRIKDVNKKIEDTVVDGYKAVEGAVVNGYKAVENGVVGGYKKIEDKFVDSFLRKDGETIDEAKERLQKENNNK